MFKCYILKSKEHNWAGYMTQGSVNRKWHQGNPKKDRAIDIVKSLSLQVNKGVVAVNSYLSENLHYWGATKNRLKTGYSCRLCEPPLHCSCVCTYKLLHKVLFWIFCWLHMIIWVSENMLQTQNFWNFSY